MSSSMPAGLSIWQVKALQDIDRLEEEKDEVLKLIAHDQSQVDELQPLIRELRSELWRVRKAMGGHRMLVSDPKNDSLRELRQRKMGAAGVAQANSRRIGKEKDLLLKRTMQVLANNNRECGVNEEIKREIALLRRERIIFDRVFTRMKEELADCKDEARQLEEEIEQSYQERDASQYQMQELKTQYEQEKHAFMKEYEDITLIIESEKRAFERITNSTKKRSKGPVLRSPEQTRAGLLMLRRRNSAFHMADQREADTLKAQERALNEDLDRLWESTSQDNAKRSGNFLEDAKLLVKQLRQREQEKYLKISQVNNKAHELETSSESVKALEQELQNVLERKQKVNSQRAAELADKQSNLLHLERQVDVAGQGRHKSRENMSLIFEPIHTLFFKVGCDKVVTSESNSMEYMTEDEMERMSIADPTTEVNSENAMIYLGVLTQRSNSVLHRYSLYLKQLVKANKRRRQEQAAAAAAAAAMGSPLKVKREREIKVKYPSVGPRSKGSAMSAYESLSNHIPSLKDVEDELNEDDLTRMLSENTKAQSMDGSMTLTDSISSRIPSKRTPHKMRTRRK